MNDAEINILEFTFDFYTSNHTVQWYYIIGIMEAKDFLPQNISAKPT